MFVRRVELGGKVAQVDVRPVTVQVDGTQVAMGFGMARRVIVELGDVAI